jgi:hypothetical protein
MFVESFQVFFIGSFQFFFKWPALPQFQHSSWLLDLDSLLPFLDLDLSRPKILPYSLPLVSRFRTALEHEVSPESLLRTSSLRIKSRISSYLSFFPPLQNYPAIVMASQLFGKDAKTINAQISLISVECCTFKLLNFHMLIS